MTTHQTPSMEDHNECEITIGWISIKLKGLIPSSIGAVGTFAVIGCCTYALWQREKLTDLLVSTIKSGSIIMEVMAENKEAYHRALTFFQSTDLLKHFNAKLQELTSRMQMSETYAIEEIQVVEHKLDKVAPDHFAELRKKALDLKQTQEKELHRLEVCIHRKLYPVVLKPASRGRPYIVNY